MPERRMRPAQIEEMLEWLADKEEQATTESDLYRYRELQFMLKTLSDRALNDRRKQRRKPVTIKGN